MLPKMSGEEVCNKIRARSSVPIIMLTAKAEEDDNPLAKLLIINNGDLEINIKIFQCRRIL